MYTMCVDYPKFNFMNNDFVGEIKDKFCETNRYDNLSI